MSDRFYADLDRVLKSRPSSAGWIHFYNFVIMVAAVLAAPFTLGLSLLSLLLIPWNSALASIVTETYRTRSLLEMQVMLTYDISNISSERLDYEAEDHRLSLRELKRQERQWLDDEDELMSDASDSWGQGSEDASTDFEESEGTSNDKNL